MATICGAGVQGRIQARAIAAVLKLERLSIWDLRPDAAVRLASRLSRQLRIDVHASEKLATTLESDVFVTCTSARQAFLTPEPVRPGTFIAAVGADNSDKQEIDPRLYAASLVVVDSLEQAAEIGDLHHALVSGTVERGHVHATLGEVLTDRRT